MTYMDPIFSQGLMGKANSHVCNAWTNAARFAQSSAEAVDWAQQQARRPLVMARALCQITNASVIPGKVNQWNYTIRLWDVPPPSGTGGYFPPADTWFTTTTCKNLREYWNDITNVDGMNLSSPPASIGPVGSFWTGTHWTTSELRAHAEVSIVYDTSGAAYFYFDRPNPMRCTE